MLRILLCMQFIGLLYRHTTNISNNLLNTYTQLETPKIQNHVVLPLKSVKMYHTTTPPQNYHLLYLRFVYKHFTLLYDFIPF
jgi:hypothetical protein